MRTFARLLLVIPVGLLFWSNSSSAPAQTDTTAQPSKEELEFIKGQIEKLKDKTLTGHLRGKAALRLGEFGPKAEPAIPALIDLLRDDYWFARAMAASTLGRIGPKAHAAVPALIERLKEGTAPDPNDPNHKGDHAVRRHAARALGRITSGQATAVKPLSAALNDKVWQVRSSAAQGLGDIGPMAKEALEALVRVTKADVESRVRMRATEAHARIDPQQLKASVTYLAATFASRDEGWWVRQEALECLGDLGPLAKDAIPTLLPFLGSKDETMRQLVGKAVEKIDPGATKKASRP